jgi:hypothetical protein
MLRAKFARSSRVIVHYRVFDSPRGEFCFSLEGMRVISDELYRPFGSTNHLLELWVISILLYVLNSSLGVKRAESVRDKIEGLVSILVNDIWTRERRIGR